VCGGCAIAMQKNTPVSSGTPNAAAHEYFGLGSKALNNNSVQTARISISTAGYTWRGVCGAKVTRASPFSGYIAASKAIHKQ
jgi:hypothetical protein